MKKALEKQTIASWLAAPAGDIFQRGTKGQHSPLPLCRESLESLYGDQALLPIEFFKLFPDELEKFFHAKRSFLSSGTTAKERSRSSFSEDGLELYRLFALKAFDAMLTRFFPGKAAGWSLIPSVEEWPTSSLAQMIEWLGDVYPLHYWDGEGPGPEEPVWLFATGFHIVAFADSGKRCPLPKGSIVIETGGTKGKTRSVTREETYALIEECFGVPRNRIISEYGMCELASQAYDFVDNPDGIEQSMTERFFRFPGWVAPQVLTTDRRIETNGRGSLIVDDSIREDLPWPIRTEDRVLLQDDGRFQLEGRVAFSPLKGCSLLAEDLLRKNAKISNQKVSTQKLESEFIDSTRAEEIHRRASAMLSDARFRNILEAELQSDILADWMLDDLRKSLPQTPEAWITAAQNARDNESVRRWIFIPPHTHSLALLHPLFIAALLNLDVAVRDVSNPAMHAYLQSVFQGFWSFRRLPASWRLPSDEAADAIMVFGSNETLATLRDCTPLPIVGFGTWLTLSLIHADSWAESPWLKDALSLRQEGCMSSRLLFVWGPSDRMKTKKAAPIGPLPFDDQLQLAHSELALRIQGYTLLDRPSPDHPVLGWKDWQDGLSLESLLSPRPFTLPIIRLQEGDFEAVTKLFLQAADLKKISVDKRSGERLPAELQSLLCPIGTANQALWDGRHGGRALFGIRNLGEV